MNKYELKKLAKKIFLYHYGFAPAVEDVKLMEADMDGTYIGVEIKGHGYQMYSELIFSPTDKTCIGVDIRNSSLNTIEW